MVVEVHTFNPSTIEAEKDGSLSLRASLVYRANFRTARATQRNPVSSKENEMLSIFHVRLIKVKTISIILRAC